MPKQTYYTGKSTLLNWVNEILDLNLTSFDEFANGAVYCQIMDAYFEECVSITRVRRDYWKEIFKPSTMWYLSHAYLFGNGALWYSGMECASNSPLYFSHHGIRLQLA